jgi:hypothetical protein
MHFYLLSKSLADELNCKLLLDCKFAFPRVVTGEKNSPTVAHACRKRRLKGVIPQVGGWSTGLATLSL